MEPKNSGGKVPSLPPLPAKCGNRRSVLVCKPGLLQVPSSGRREDSKGQGGEGRGQGDKCRVPGAGWHTHFPLRDQTLVPPDLAGEALPPEPWFSRLKSGLPLASLPQEQHTRPHCCHSWDRETPGAAAGAGNQCCGSYSPTPQSPQAHLGPSG